MPDVSRPREPQHLTCEVCAREIPASVGLTAEGPDYILHFCGFECMDHWKTRPENDGKK
jgi:hypothetical protein